MAGLGYKQVRVLLSERSRKFTVRQLELAKGLRERKAAANQPP
jgi:hypothetical protein